MLDKTYLTIEALASVVGGCDDHMPEPSAPKRNKRRAAPTPSRDVLVPTGKPRIDRGSDETPSVYRDFLNGTKLDLDFFRFMR